MKYLGICFRYLPLILSVFAPVSFFITYGVAVGYDHVTWFWPYISDTGANPPESCIFGLLLNTIAFALSVIVYLRYRYVSDFVKMKPQVKIKRWLNKSATTFGYLSCFGLVIVANFEETSQIIVHVIGAIMAFCFGSLYFGFQTFFTYKIEPSSKIKFWIRAFLTFFGVTCIVGFLAPIAPAISNFKGKDFLKWKPEDGGFGLHLTSTFFEWFLMFSYCFFFVTMFLDFRQVKIIPPQIRFVTLEMDDSKVIDQGELNDVTKRRCSINTHGVIP